jgi:hypothetical protein
MTSEPRTHTKDAESETDTGEGTDAHKDDDLRKADRANGENPDQ